MKCATNDEFSSISPKFKQKPINPLYKVTSQSSAGKNPQLISLQKDLDIDGLKLVGVKVQSQENKFGDLKNTTQNQETSI